MLSKKQLRSDIEAVEIALKKRNFSFDINQEIADELARAMISDLTTTI
jgi:hypothetical protein